jgi:hypothetical protein
MRHRVGSFADVVVALPGKFLGAGDSRIRVATGKLHPQNRRDRVTQLRRVSRRPRDHNGLRGRKKHHISGTPRDEFDLRIGLAVIGFKPEGQLAVLREETGLTALRRLNVYANEGVRSLRLRHERRERQQCDGDE